MPADITVYGVDRLETIVRRLKETGDKELRKELYRGLNRAAKPLKEAAKDGALRRLPQRGGLNESVAASKFSISTRGSGRSPGVRLTGKKKTHDLRRMDAGRLRHPVFGNRRVWVTQNITPGWFSESIAAEIGQARDEMVRVLDEVAGRIVRG